MAKANNSTINQIAFDDEKKKEISKVKSLLKDVDKRKVKGMTELIDNVSFMAIHLRDLQKTINSNGKTCEYQNGENQFGVKKSPEIEIYNTMIKNYTSTMKVILDASGKTNVIADDGFEAFVHGKSKG